MIKLANDSDFDLIFDIYLSGLKNSFDKSEINPSNLRLSIYEDFKNRNGVFNYWIKIDELTHNVNGFIAIHRMTTNPIRSKHYGEISIYFNQTNNTGNLRNNYYNAIELAEYVHDYAKNNSDLHYLVGFIARTNKATIKVAKLTGYVEVGEMPNSKHINDKHIRRIFVNSLQKDSLDTIGKHATLKMEY